MREVSWILPVCGPVDEGGNDHDDASKEDDQTQLAQEDEKIDEEVHGEPFQGGSDSCSMRIGKIIKRVNYVYAKDVCS